MVESCDFLDKYVLVGGSALTLHLCHRKSEDLDFFTFEDNFDFGEIFEYIKQFSQKEILNKTDEQIDLLIDGVKVTFFNARWSFLKPPKSGRFHLATLEQIAAMKVNVLFLRAKYRDYYDLYFLAKEVMSLRQIFKCGENIVEGITYKLFVVGLLYIDDVEDDDITYLQPKEKISKQKIRDFFDSRVKHH
jgi:predicted nucleotidyltransferase component of viral defense system